MVQHGSCIARVRRHVHRGLVDNVSLSFSLPASELRFVRAANDSIVVDQTAHDVILLSHLEGGLFIPVKKKKIT
jgi:hypothetical protein